MATRRNFNTLLGMLLGSQSTRALSFADTLTSGLASITRIPFAAGEGTTVAETISTSSAAPATQITLYDFEACPYCRNVREAVTVLDLDILIKPCPRGSPFRDEVLKYGGKTQFPFLVDDELGLKIYESDAIIEHLVEKYRGGSVAVKDAAPRIAGPRGTVAGLAASAFRGFRGGALSSRALATSGSIQPLELYSYENNQFCRPVREALCELGVPYRIKSCGKGSPRRALLAGIRPGGSTRCPYLVDPNTGTALGESRDILAYLEAQYSANDPKFRSNLAEIKAAIVELSSTTEGGIKDTELLTTRAQMEELLAALEQQNPTKGPSRSQLFSGKWDLLWSTEREVLFAREKGLFLDGPCTGVTQTIDAKGGRLENRIEFAGGGFLQVLSSLEPDEDGNGFSFAFSSCSLGWRRLLEIPLPPFGKGNARVTFLDDTMRVQRDSRGDTLVCTRKGALDVGKEHASHL